MRDDYTLLTPENVELRFDVAGVGSRVLAATIDYLIILFGYFALTFAGAFAFGALQRAFPRVLGAEAQPGPILGFAAIAMVVLLAFFGWWGYFVLFELLWNGQTPGKRLLGLRVVGVGGQPIHLVASLVRNVVRAIDLALLLGVVVMLIDRSSRRLGDLAAGSLVIREPRGLARSALDTVPLPSASPAAIEALPNVDRLTMAHYTLIRDYFARRPRLADGDALASRLAAELAQTLEVSPRDFGDPVLFIGTVARAYEARHSYREP